MIPSRMMVWLALGPLVLSIATVFQPSLWVPVVLVDAGLVLLALFDFFLSRSNAIEIQRQVPSVVSVGRWNVVTLQVRSKAARRLFVELTDDVFEEAEIEDLPLKATLAGRQMVTRRYRIRPTRRGAYILGSHHVRYPSVLGLWVRQLELPARHEVKVYPDIQSVRSYELLAMRDQEVAGIRTTKKRGGESEFERLREYRSGDEFRLIDWKATARRQKLISRDYQLESNQTVMFLLDAGRLMTGETLGLSLFDHSLNATLMLSHVAARGGDRLGLLAFADKMYGYSPPETGRGAARKIVQASYNLHPSLLPTDYEVAFQQLGQRVRRRSLVVLFTQVTDAYSASELIKFSRRLMPRHLPLVVLLRDVEIDSLVHGTSTETRQLTGAGAYIRGAAAEIIQMQQHLVMEMKSKGALVLDVAPAQLTPALINRYLDIKAHQLL